MHRELRAIVDAARSAQRPSWLARLFGFRRRKGWRVALAGGDGPSRCAAAEAVAEALGRLLLTVDLAAVVSNYIGETEKNLEAVFARAEASGAVLFFDEADALFGKRSEVKDSHDRYANIEINYLLQRMEAFSGLAILATNLRDTLDPAVLRRLDAAIDWPPKGG